MKIIIVDRAQVEKLCLTHKSERKKNEKKKKNPQPNNNRASPLCVHVRVLVQSCGCCRTHNIGFQLKYSNANDAIHRRFDLMNNKIK